MADDWNVGATMVSNRTGRIVVTVHGPKNPSDEEWLDYLDWIQRGEVPLSETRTLVRSFGGGPNAVQRGQLTEIVEGRSAFKAKAVLLTDSLFVRGIGIALSWFKVSLRVLAPDKLDAAFEYLELNDSEATEAQQLLEQVRARFEQESRDVGT